MDSKSNPQDPHPDLGPFYAQNEAGNIFFALPSTPGSVQPREIQENIVDVAEWATIDPEVTVQKLTDIWNYKDEVFRVRFQFCYICGTA
jgi:hypothetical protein